LAKARRGHPAASISMNIEDLYERAFYPRKEIATLLRVTPQFVGQL